MIRLSYHERIPERESRILTFIDDQPRIISFDPGVWQVVEWLEREIGASVEEFLYDPSTDSIPENRLDIELADIAVHLYLHFDRERKGLANDNFLEWGWDSMEKYRKIK